METAASTLYERLNPDTSEIRLLEVPSDGSEDWGLITVSLDDNPEYFALSYVWGEEKDLKKIALQGQDKEVTPNLASALSHIRSGNIGRTSTPIKYLWADAICINQEDIYERSQQVQLMSRIFKCAQAVCAWVGPKDHSRAFETIRELANEVALHYSSYVPNDRDEHVSFGILDMPPFELEWLQRHPSLCSKTPNTEGKFKNDAWNSIGDLFLEKYWERVWIYQEVVLASRLHLFSSGGMTLSRQDLFMFAQSYTELDLKTKIRRGKVQRPEFLCQEVWEGLRWFPPHHGIDSLRDAWKIIIMNDTLRPIKEFWAECGLCPSWKQSIAATRLVAKDPKDYIYGLLAITQIPMTPDYTKSDAEVYTEFVERWIEASLELEVRNKPIMQLEQSRILPLGFLSLAGVGHFGSSDDFPFPSWAPNFPKNALHRETRILQVTTPPSQSREDPSRYPYLDRKTGSLVVLGAEIEPVLHVSNFTSPACFEEPTGFDNLKTIRKLFCDIKHSFRCYTSRHPRSISGTSSWQDIARLLYKKVSKDVTEDMVYSLLTLAAVSSPNETENYPDGLGGWDSPDSSIFPTDWETQLYQRAFPDKYLTELKFNDNPFADKESRKDKLLDHLITLCQEIGDRSIFETKRGYLGRGPLDVREGDRLCVLKHYDQPVSLHQLGDHYTFVGTVFVVDLNQPEWIQDNPSGLEWLTLR
ncbi:uncharacterized protein NECHADRAFT_75566 [Fusarium vanettenii 77-13-4]|uniref:Heterokaryon incompatibility domain-containing protein n=1 Tax=Fusarium vanettenii (strain ATCC MYA-4622 / CBS 123669 / FGSC 9596 / NRRL 45880 / 77-13-4) TaxID=660122 RepID=C7YJ60_FUSV7|nr:uncharacterized protein NECHADRAFT_75566 [Fusarium vanettenii 77-13-4]EEU48211.1 hypothetical protein NECHADRAFT_75566 [Fusarium vanettenii 77-13-4]